MCAPCPCSMRPAARSTGPNSQAGNSVTVNRGPAERGLPGSPSEPQLHPHIPGADLVSSIAVSGSHSCNHGNFFAAFVSPLE
eukprot:99600-Pelagomonas_calceolata.AAC.1